MIVQVVETPARYGWHVASRCGHVVAVGPMFDAGSGPKNEASLHAYSTTCISPTEGARIRKNIRVICAVDPWVRRVPTLIRQSASASRLPPNWSSSVGASSRNSASRIPLLAPRDAKVLTGPGVV